ncbi:MAG: hypothetical protein NTW87_36725 [Planctomycetota bacterium]|nr:hypothetical protein [Planctomycetota bacterium]
MDANECFAGIPSGLSDDDAWARLTVEQFFAGYSDADAIYDWV